MQQLVLPLPPEGRCPPSDVRLRSVDAAGGGPASPGRDGDGGLRHLASTDGSAAGSGALSVSSASERPSVRTLDGQRYGEEAYWETRYLDETRGATYDWHCSYASTPGLREAVSTLRIKHETAFRAEKTAALEQACAWAQQLPAAPPSAVAGYRDAASGAPLRAPPRLQSEQDVAP